MVAMMTRFSRLVCLILAIGLLPAVCHAGADGGRMDGEGYHIVNLMPTFWAFWEKAEKLPSQEKVRLFRTMVQEPNASVFAAAAPSASRDDVVSAYLEDLPRFIPAMRALSDRLTAELPACRKSFQKAFPDMTWAGNIYFLPSCFTFDGAVRQVDGKAALVFGVDMIAVLHGAQGNIAPLFHHELFHVYHRGRTPEAFSGDFLGKMWTEGLAVYASQQLNPTATMGDLLVPPDLVRRSDADLPRLARDVRDKLGSRDFTDFQDYFDGGSKRPDVPVRAGYYIGLVVVRDTATRMSLVEMAQLKGEDLRREVRAALHHIDGIPLSAAECRQDIAFVFARIEANCARPYAFVGESTMLRERANLERSLTEPLTRAQFYARLAPIIARLRDPEIFLGFPQQPWTTYRATGGLSFPFDVRIRDGKIFVASSALDDTEIGPGTEIRTINGIPARRIITDLLALSSASDLVAKEADASRRFVINLYFLYNWPGPYNVEYNPAGGGKTLTRVVDGITDTALARKQQGVSSTPERNEGRMVLLPNSGLTLYLGANPAEQTSIK